MAERNANLLLSDEEQPDNGIQRSNVKRWYGGPLQVAVSGEFDGATVDLLLTTRMPADGEAATYEDDEAHPDTDFIEIGTATEPEVFTFEHMNPCALVVRVSNSGNDTRVRAVIQ